MQLPYITTLLLLKWNSKSNKEDKSHKDQRSVATIQGDQKTDIEKPVAYAIYATS